MNVTRLTKPLLPAASGLVLGVGLTLAALASWPAPPPSAPVTYYAAAAPGRSTEDLALKLTPKVQQFLADNRDEFVSHAGGPMERLAVRWGIPVAQRETPVVLEHGLEALATELNTWSMADMLHWLSSVADDKNATDGRLVRELRAAAP